MPCILSDGLSIKLWAWAAIIRPSGGNRRRGEVLRTCVSSHPCKLADECEMFRDLLLLLGQITSCQPPIFFSTSPCPDPRPDACDTSWKRNKLNDVPLCPLIRHRYSLALKEMWKKGSNRSFVPRIMHTRGGDNALMHVGHRERSPHEIISIAIKRDEGMMSFLIGGDKRQMDCQQF